MEPKEKEQLNVVWQKNAQNNEWFDFLKLNLESQYFQQGRKGVFMIWNAGGRVIKIGSGNLLEQLKNLRSNPLILDYSKHGPLKVAWVAVNGVLKEEQLPGAEAFLQASYLPLLGERSQAEPIPIKLLS